MTARARADSVDSIGGSASDSESSFEPVISFGAYEMNGRWKDGRCGSSDEPTIHESIYVLLPTSRRTPWRRGSTCPARQTRRMKCSRRGRRSGARSTVRRTKEEVAARHPQMAGRAADRHHQMDARRSLPPVVRAPSRPRPMSDVGRRSAHGTLKPSKSKFGNRNGVWKVVTVVAKMRINAHLS